jgi:hypothetical protein
MSVSPKKRHYAHWKRSEDNKLQEAIARFEEDWDAVSNAVGKDVRACRARWNTHFCTVNQEEWSPEEDEMLLDLSQVLYGKWVAIAKLLQTQRSRIQCQTRYRLLQRRNEKHVLHAISEMTLE